MKKNEYIREYNKDTYKIVKVYIREEDYPQIMEHMKKQGYKKLSGYIKDLIIRDMDKTGEQRTEINVGKNTGLIVGDNNGTINM